MRITFLGGAGTVTGSCHALEVGGRVVLLDCGQFQGTPQMNGPATSVPPLEEFSQMSGPSSR